MNLSELALFTDEVQATTTFYEALFGTAVVADEEIALFDIDGVEVLIHQTSEDPDWGLPQEDHVVFRVTDVDETVGALSENGLTVFREPADYEWGRSAYIWDPDDRFVELPEE